MAHNREGSIPRMPFATPIVQQKAYREPAQQTTPRNNAGQPSSIAQPSRSQAPTLNVIIGFDNPRTPPAPWHGFKPATNHSRNGSLQQRRAANATDESGSLGVSRPVYTELSPSDGTVLIGFDQALKKLNLQTSERKLNIQPRTEYLVSPIAPSIIITGIPRDGESMDDMFLRPVDPRHRSSIYSQHVAVRQAPAQRRDSIDSAPPVPMIPHDLLDVDRTLPHNMQSSRITSWDTDFDDDDQSITYVGSLPPIKDGLKVHLLERKDTTATTRSQGWWNTITTPFLLQRSATLDKGFPRSPAAHSSSHPSPQPSTGSGSGHVLSEANIAALTREHTSPALDPTTPHLADEKRQTIGFFGDATPKTATFPPVPPIPESHLNKGIMSPEFVDAGAFGEAAEYFEASWHDLYNPEPFFPCVDHDCSLRIHKDAIADAKSRQLFLASAEVDRANKAHDMSEHLSAQASHSAPRNLSSLPAIAIPEHDTRSPSLVDHVQPSDSISQVAERRAVTDAVTITGRRVPETHNYSANRQTVFSDSIGSPEVAEATAVPIMRAVTPGPMQVTETRGISQVPPKAKAAPVSVHAAAATELPRAFPAPAPSSAPTPAPAPAPAPAPSPAPAPVSKLAAAAPMAAPVMRTPYPESSGMPGTEYVPPPPPPPPPPMMNPYPVSPQLAPAKSLSLAPPETADTHTQITRSMSPMAYPKSSTNPSNQGPQPPAGYMFDNQSNIGMARSMQNSALEERPETVDRTQRAQVSPSPGPTAGSGAPTVVSSRNPFKRQPPPPLSVTHSPQLQDDVSPGAITPSMARDAEIGNAVPMQPAPQASLARNSPASAGDAIVAKNQDSTFTRRARMERYDQRNSPAQQTEEQRDYAPAPVFIPASQGNVYQNPYHTLSSGTSVPIQHDSSGSHRDHTPLPAPVFVPGAQRGSFHDVESSRGMDEKDSADLPPRPPQKPSKFALLLAAWKTGRQQRPKKTKEQKRKRRCCCLIFFGLFFLVLLIVLLVMFLTIPRHDMPVQSSWLNLTNYPPIPTGVATIARPNAVQEQSRCIVPQTMWSCAVPREQQDGIKPNEPDQPNFRLEIRFQNGTSMSNGTTVSSNRKTNGLLQRDIYAASLWNPSPAPPSEDDQIFMGNTTDHNAAPYDGEQTPFFITFLPTTTSSNQKREISKRSPSATSSASSLASPSSTDYFPDLASAIPSPAVNADGTAASATLYPLTTAQPLRLYNRNQPDEHYGFYTYFDRSIFLTSVTLGNGSLSNSMSDVTGGSPLSSATKRCTWSQTRFLVQIWTGGPKEAGNQHRQLLNGSSTAEAAAAGNITAKSWGNFLQPGSFPYPVTVTLDRHGGAAKEKMVYCYGVDGGKINATDKKISLEDRRAGGTLIANPGGFLSNASSSGPIDGGTGGCGCVWQNWQNI